MTPDSKAVVARLEEAAGNVRSGGWVESAATCLEAADLIETLTAPVDGLETTAEERAMWRTAWEAYHLPAGGVEEPLRLLRDFDRLHAQLAAERARAARMAEAGRPFLRDVPDDAEDHDTVGMTVTSAELRNLRAALTPKETP